MTLVLQGSNAKGIDAFLQVLQTWMFPNLNDAERERVMAHFDWMRQQSGNLSINCRLESQEATQVTRIVLEASFAPLPPWKNPKGG